MVRSLGAEGGRSKCEHVPLSSPNGSGWNRRFMLLIARGKRNQNRKHHYARESNPVPLSSPSSKGNTMRRHASNVVWFFLFGIFLVRPTCGGEPPIRAQDINKLFGFDKEVTFQLNELGAEALKQDSKYSTVGDAVAGYNYSSQQSAHSYLIYIVTGKTLFRDNRERVEMMLREIVDEKGRENYGVVRLTDKREAFYMVMGFGSGGEGHGVFATLPGGEYDLLIMDSIAYAEIPTRPAKPRKKVRETYEEIEARVVRALARERPVQKVAPKQSKK